MSTHNVAGPDGQTVAVDLDDGVPPETVLDRMERFHAIWGPAGGYLAQNDLGWLIAVARAAEDVTTGVTFATQQAAVDRLRAALVNPVRS